MIVFLDTNILNLITTPGDRDEAEKCKMWFYTLLVRGAYITTSDICIYEISRGLLAESLRRGKELEGLQELTELKNQIELQSVTQAVLNRAALVWAQSQYQGLPMTDAKRLDADAIICAHWQLLEEENQGRSVIIASTNLRHLNRFAIADLWQNVNL